MRYEIYNYKTGDTAGVSFPTKQQAQDWIARRKAETSLRLYWRVRKVKSNPRRGRTMARRTTRKSNARATDRWGVYVKSQLAYVSTKKLDANKAASRLRLSGRANISIKQVRPNPISGIVPKVGWRAEFKKAAYSAMKAPGVRRKRARTTSKIRQTRQRRGENPRRKAKSSRAMDVFDRHQLKIARDTLKMPDAMVGVMGGPSKVEAREIIKRITAKYKRNPAGPSSRAVAGRIGRAVGARVKSRNPKQYRPEKRGDFWYVARYTDGTRDKWGGMNTSFTTRAEALKYANQINKANRYPSANPRRAGVGTRSVMRGGTFRGAVGRKRNAPSILRRRNPTYVIWNNVKNWRVAGYTFKSRSTAEKAADRISRQSSQSTSYSVIPLMDAKRREKSKIVRRSNPRTSANPSSGYVVQVGNTVAWVGKLAADAQKAMRKLMAGGRKGVKGFAAKLPVGIKRGWRSQFKAMSRKRNSTKRPTVAYGPPGTVVKTRAEWGSVANAKDYVRRHGGAAFVVNADGRSGVVYTLGVGGRIHERKVRANASFGKGKLGSGSRFKSCVRTMKRRGVASPSGLCASIGRRKYGAKRMAGMAKRGRARRSNPQQPSRRWEGYFLRAANEKTVYSLGDLRRDQAMRAAAGLARRKGADVTVYRGKTSLWPSGRTTYGTKKRIALIKVGS